MLDEALDSLIYSAIEGFETSPDIASLERIKDTQSKTAELRRQKIEALSSKIQTLENELSSIQSELKLLSQPSATLTQSLEKLAPGKAHAADDVFKTMNAISVDLDNEKVALAKRLTELESAINSLTMNKIKRTRQIEEVASQREQALSLNVANNFNTASMKISLFKKFGVHIEDTKDSNDKIMVFDRASQSASVLDVDPKYSDYFISNYIWDKLGNAE